MISFQNKIFFKTKFVGIKNNVDRKQNRKFHDLLLQELIVPCSIISGLAIFMFGANRYKISKPDEYLVRTGLGIKDINISKQGFRWPFQKCKFIDMHPKNYSFNLNAMSNEKINFILPGIFTIGPKNDKDALTKYVRILENVDKHDDQTIKTIDTIILGILEGEVRTLSSSMSMEELFSDRKSFKEKILKEIQEELDQVGLWIYNANIKELQDSEDSKYFFNIRQKKLSEAENNAKIHISEAKKIGDIGQKSREAETRQQLAQFESETVKKENEKRQEIEMSIAQLEIVKAEALRKKEIAKIEALNAANMRQAELQKLVEEQNLKKEIERLRANDLSKAQVHLETLTKEAEGQANAIKIQADAHLYSKQKEAEGIQKIYEAQSHGIDKLIGTFGNNSNNLLKYLMLDKGLYKELAEINAKAIQNLNPKITIWNTSNDSGSSDNYTKPIADILKMIPPLVTTIHEQTGISLPESILKMPKKENMDKNIDKNNLD